MSDGIDQLKSAFGAEHLTLVGYSGGGAIAALLAARRNDVKQLITVAGNLDHRAWTSYHRVAPLTGSLNASDVRAQLSTIPQKHFFGLLDRVIPPRLAFDLPIELRGSDNSYLQFIQEHDHQCCWAKIWPQLWTELQ